MLQKRHSTGVFCILNLAMYAIAQSGPWLASDHDGSTDKGSPR